MSRTRDEIHPIVKGSPYTFKDFSQQIAKMIGVTWTEKYEARIMQCVAPKGTTRATEYEQEAMDAWCDVQQDVAGAAMQLMAVQSVRNKAPLIIDWLQGRRRYQQSDAQSAIRVLKSL
jgi:hypothetical protein